MKYPLQLLVKVFTTVDQMHDHELQGMVQAGGDTEILQRRSEKSKACGASQRDARRAAQPPRKEEFALLGHLLLMIGLEGKRSRWAPRKSSEVGTIVVYNFMQ